MHHRGSGQEGFFALLWRLALCVFCQNCFLFSTNGPKQCSWLDSSLLLRKNRMAIPNIYICCIYPYIYGVNIYIYIYIYIYIWVYIQYFWQGSHQIYGYIRCLNMRFWPILVDSFLLRTNSWSLKLCKDMVSSSHFSFPSHLAL